MNKPIDNAYDYLISKYWGGSPPKDNEHTNALHFLATLKVATGCVPNVSRDPLNEKPKTENTKQNEFRF